MVINDVYGLSYNHQYFFVIILINYIFIVIMINDIYCCNHQCYLSAIIIKNINCHNHQ